MTLIVSVMICALFGSISAQVPKSATVELVPGSSPTVGGNLSITATPDGIKIEGIITGLTPGLHGFHIHEKGSLGNECKEAGPHFNPFNQNHGDQTDAERHVGDLGNIEADESGTALIRIIDPKASLESSSEAFVGDRAVVVHASPDDLGKGGNEESLKTGNAGARLACGIISIQPETRLLTSFGQNSDVDATVNVIPGSSSTVNGKLTLQATDGGVSINGVLRGLSPGYHGFHIHEKGDLGNECVNAGPHFNPFNKRHGDPKDEERHIGDLGNIEVDRSGNANINLFDPKASLDPLSPAYIGQRALVVHADPDDLGRGRNDESGRTGNAGKRVGCGVIELLRQGQGGGGPKFQPTLTQNFDGLGSKYATAEILPGQGRDVSGKLEFVQSPGGINIKGTIKGLTPGRHGFHIHENGDLGNACNNAGGHFNPFRVEHGDLNGAYSHVGDLGNIDADRNGMATVSITHHKGSLESNSKTYIGNLAIVVHADQDDLGRGNSEFSKRTGNSGARVGCGIIKVQEGESSANNFNSLNGALLVTMSLLSWKLITKM